MVEITRQEKSFQTTLAYTYDPCTDAQLDFDHDNFEDPILAANNEEPIVLALR